MSKRRLLSLIFVLLVTVGVTIVSVAVNSQAMWARIVGGIVAGLFFSGSVLAYLKLSKRVGLVTGVIAISVAWGIVFFVLAYASPHCPASPNSSLSSRCTLSGASSFLGIGLLTPVVFLFLFGPIVYAVRIWRRTSSFQHRHPVKSVLVAAKLWALRKTGRTATPVAPKKARTDKAATTSSGRPSTTSKAGSTASAGRGGATATSTQDRAPVAKTRAKGRPDAPGIVHNKRTTSSPKRPPR
jgi:hypothetical protein